MTERIEVQRLSGRADLCEVEYAEGRYMIAVIGDDTLVCNRRLGAWYELSYASILGRLNIVDDLLRAAKTTDTA